MEHYDIQHLAKAIVPSGSRVICNPAPTDTDQDFLVYLDASKTDPSDFMEYIIDMGYSTDGGESYDIFCELDDGGWGSFRKGDVNYIVTFSADFFDRFVLATNIAQRLNLLDKSGRIKLFQYILYEADLW